ncbi:hypothetical protein OH76DRAFT_171833 [Lentinus brumalis]|uniref:F-box domain-containing protein n=1 Tax=Lentinus brumalis TaxID=2498619 RepID=A0A371DJA3_9APHY|nr:hypothetical protein OH76DRAFT_171833 [Polyporus brumalis]
MHMSAESLSFPIDVAPLARLVELSWPRLRDLTLTGRYSHASQASSTASLVGSMSRPRSISIQLTQLADCPRPMVLEKHKLRLTDMHGLERFTIAYPNPDDAIFSAAGPSLRRLSLRDYPRHYTGALTTHMYEMDGMAMPILSSCECLRILSRMSMPRLEHLELVYEADDREEELLVHVASAYPHLQTLELHQYRASCGSVALRFDRVSKLLSSVKTLRTVHLNLDYTREDTTALDPDWPGTQYDDDDQEYFRWPSSTALVQYGSALLQSLERLGWCPVFEALYLLYFDACHHEGQHRWVRFLPARYPGREAERVDWDDDYQRLYVVRTPSSLSQLIITLHL